MCESDGVRPGLIDDIAIPGAETLSDEPLSDDLRGDGRIEGRPIRAPSYPLDTHVAWHVAISSRYKPAGEDPLPSSRVPALTCLLYLSLLSDTNPEQTLVCQDGL